MSRELRLACIGCGAMGSALVKRISLAKLAKEISLHDINPLASQKLAADCGAKIIERASQAGDSNLILLAVKPDHLAGLLDQELAIAFKDKLVVSIAAGVDLKRLKSLLPDSRIIRAMPNTPALVGAGVIAWTPDPACQADDLELFTDAFQPAGELFRLEEKHLDAVTGLSGSGPAYAFLLINALAEGGVREGLSKEIALKMAAQTFYGSALMLLKSNEHPEILKDRVTSPGGTTAAGLATLESYRIRSAMSETVQSATRRSRELGSG